MCLGKSVDLNSMVLNQLFWINFQKMWHFFSTFMINGPRKLFTKIDGLGRKKTAEKIFVHPMGAIFSSGSEDRGLKQIFWQLNANLNRYLSKMRCLSLEF